MAGHFSVCFFWHLRSFSCSFLQAVGIGPGLTSFARGFIYLHCSCSSL